MFGAGPDGMTERSQVWSGAVAHVMVARNLLWNLRLSCMTSSGGAVSSQVELAQSGWNLCIVCSLGVGSF